MEKYRFDLQLFAEEPPAQAQPEGAEPPEGQEPAQEQGAGDKKYTDKEPMSTVTNGMLRRNDC